MRLFICIMVLTPSISGQQQWQMQGPAIMANALAEDVNPQQIRIPPQKNSEINARIRSNLQSMFDGDMLLRGADVNADVDDQSIVLTGTVETYLQHERVLALVSPFTRYRSVVDKLKLQ